MENFGENAISFMTNFTESIEFGIFMVNLKFRTSIIKANYMVSGIRGAKAGNFGPENFTIMVAKLKNSLA